MHVEHRLNAGKDQINDEQSKKNSIDERSGRMTVDMLSPIATIVRTAVSNSVSEQKTWLQ